MARKPTPQQVYEELLGNHEKALAEAFAKAISEITSVAELSRIVKAIEVGDIETALAALHLDPAAYGPLSEAMRAAYLDGGQAATEAMPAKTADGARLVVRFDVRNPRAEAWLQDHSSELVTRIIDDQRTAVRAALTDGMVKGENPRTTALDIVGRLNRATGKREGGALGLSAPQELAARTAQAELASGDPAQMRNYLTRARRDKRFDKSVAKAIKDGKPLPKDTASKAIGQYKNRLLKLRGEMIGRTEALTALNTAQHESLRQAIDSGQIKASDVRRTWKSAHDLRVRTTHAALDGETVGFSEAFTSPSGARMMHPGDSSLGAPASELISCRCWVSTRIDFLSNLR